MDDFEDEDDRARLIFKQEVTELTEKLLPVRPPGPSSRPLSTVGPQVLVEQGISSLARCGREVMVTIGVLHAEALWNAVKAIDRRRGGNDAVHALPLEVA